MEKRQKQKNYCNNYSDVTTKTKCALKMTG